MTLHLRPITRANLASQVIDGMLAGPELESHRDHAGAAAANLAELRTIVPPPSFILSAPQLNKHKSATLEAA